MSCGCSVRIVQLPGATAQTPWTGTSLSPALTIAAGGVDGHAPVFNFDGQGLLDLLRPLLFDVEVQDTFGVTLYYASSSNI